MAARASLVGLSLCATIAVAAQAQADGARVVLVGLGADPTVVRMRQELGVIGFEVEQVPAERAGRGLAAIGRFRKAAAVVRVSTTPPSIALWFDPATSGAGAGAAPMPVELTVDAELTGTSDPGLLALRAVELVRGRLLPVPAPPSAPPAPADARPIDGGGEAAPPASKIAPAPSSAPASEPRPVATHAVAGWSRDASILVAPAILASPGGLPPAPAVLLGGRARLIDRAEIEAFAIVPTVGASAEDAPGKATLRLAAIAFGGAVELTPPRGRVFVTAGIGAGLALLFFAGEGTPPYQPVSGARAAALPYAHLASGVAVGPRVGIRLDLIAGLLRPEPVLRVAGADLASFGSPAVLAAVGLEVRP